MKRAVVDQPGLKIIFVGLLIAIFFGLLVRSQITDHKINFYLKNLVQSVQEKNKDQNLSIDFSDARLHLTDWGLPFPHLVIQNIKISSLNSECSDNQLYIERLDIPFNWLNLFKSKIDARSFVDTVRISQAEFRLNNIDKCLNNKSKISPATSETMGKLLSKAYPPVVNASEAVNIGFEQELNILFEKIKIIDKHNYNIPIILQAASARLTILKNEIIFVDAKSQMFLFKDLDRSIYQVRADLKLNYTHRDNQVMQAGIHVRGKLVDKTFDLKLDYDPTNKKILINHSMSDLSLKAVLKLFNHNDLGEQIQKQVDGVTGLALSNQGQGEYNLKKPETSFYKITNLSIASGESAATCESIDITSFKPFVYKPFKIELNQFDLEKIKTIAALSSIQKSINSYGKVSGIIQVASDGKISSQGTIHDLEFIFSNRGRQANQKIDQLNYTVSNNKVVINLLSLEGEKNNGELSVDFSPNKARIIDLILTDIKLNDSVYEIFSFNQSKKTLIQLSAHLENNALKAKIKFDQLVSTYFELKQAEATYEASLDPASQKVVSPVLDLYIKNLRLNKKQDSEESFYGILDQLEPEINVNDFYFDGVKAKYLRKDANLFEVAISANYFSKTKNEKSSVNIESQYIDATNAVFNFNWRQGSHNMASKIQADLNRFNFEIKK